MTLSPQSALKRNRTRLAAAAAFLAWAAAPAATLAEPSILFIRGAERSGGFLEAGPNDASRTEQLSDIANAQTFDGNHGWKELADTLAADGFAVTQLTETLAPDAPPTGPTEGVALDLTTIDLRAYDTIVFGSNNGRYTEASVDALERYVRHGGGAVFISDANFGSDWADASDSDQPFLDRFGLVMHQDRGTYSLLRDEGDFLVPGHPILDGVDRFDGEGVTPIRVVDRDIPGVNATILANAKGQTRLNEPPFGGRNQGPSRDAGPDDAASVAVTAERGRLVGHFDRNTFFNLNGAGTNLNRFDNERYALNLFRWVTQVDVLVGDYDGSGLVEQGDLNLVLLNWGVNTLTEGVPVTWIQDLPVGVIDQDELNRVLNNWGADAAPDLSHTAVPEPAVASTLALTLSLLAVRRR
ncbi:MAG: hypothetical protein AAGE65_07330 [Planctomycetota bacterium]